MSANQEVSVSPELGMESLPAESVKRVWSWCESTEKDRQKVTVGGISKRRWCSKYRRRQQTCQLLGYRTEDTTGESKANLPFLF